MDIQESDVQYIVSFSRGFIFEIWLSMNGSDIEKRRQVLQQLKDMVPKADNLDIADLEKVIKYICQRITSLWKSAYRKKNTVLNNNSKWLSVRESVTLPKISITNKSTPHDIPDHPSSSKAAAVAGRPKKDFAACSKQSQRRRIDMLAQVDESAVRHLRKTSEPSTSELSPDEVLSLITEAKLTKHQYLLLRKFINSRSNPVLPSYGKIVEAKKQCYPEVITVTETTAEVELQSLLNHTAARIVESQKEVLAAIPQESMGDVFLIGKWGFDGSTGHSEYKQNFANSDVTEDGSLFVTSYVPLRLVSTDSSSEETILWKNPRPSSTRYCRPIRFQFIKETKDSTVNELNYFQEKIDKLVPTKLKYGDADDKEIDVNHFLRLTMVDGKICSALSDTSNAKCFICGALPKQMNNIDCCITRSIDYDKLEFGLSPLHSWIRFFEYFIRLSYKLQTQRWQARSAEDKNHVALTKKKIQGEFRQKLGLIVDKPRSGGSGTSNDGNTARKFFKNAAVSAEITGIQQCLIERCGVLLECMSSGYNINTTQFDAYAIETAKQLVTAYPWYPLPSSVHKVLLHGAIVIENALVSIGELSEEAAESTNKNIKLFRLNHARKMSRVLTNTDLLNRLLLNSDPMITSIRQLPRKNKMLLSANVLSLLDCTY